MDIKIGGSFKTKLEENTTSVNYDYNIIVEDVGNEEYTLCIPIKFKWFCKSHNRVYNTISTLTDKVGMSERTNAVIKIEYNIEKDEYTVSILLQTENLTYCQTLFMKIPEIFTEQEEEVALA